MSSILIGRYVPTDSQIHRLDPRTKLIFVMLFVVITFLCENLVEYGFLAVITTLIISKSAVSPSIFVKSIKPFWLILVFAFLLHIFTSKEGPRLLDLGFIEVYQHGLEQGVEILIRFLLLILVTTLLTLSTTPVEITDALETIFNPLKKIGLPVHEGALMLSIALRFIPTLADEADKVIKAQASRGLVIDHGSYLKRMFGMISIIIPLFINSFKRAEELSNAMESRGYRGGMGRTKYRQLKWTNKDNMVIITTILIMVIFYII
ncbi:MAG: cbiQ [Bacillales bacterium]|jgi:energy-coupling factor transport system permease protein|nr:cbiQ [Bacillales bacterium]